VAQLARDDGDDADEPERRGRQVRRSSFRHRLTVYCHDVALSRQARYASCVVAPRNPPLGRIVRTQREQLRLTQAELAEQVGVSRSAVSELEAGRIAQPRATVFARLAKVLGIPAAALLAAAGYPEADVLLEIEGDELAVLATSLTRIAGGERAWLRSRLLELRDLLVLRQAERTGGRPRAAIAGRRRGHRRGA
jgi:transcriptional regulator with XRE-family HTH domain